MDNKNQQQNLADQKGGIGRISNTGNQGQPQEHRDISHIDRQEGEMEHGEVGGNFDKSTEEGKKDQSS